MVNWMKVNWQLMDTLQVRVTTKYNRKIKARTRKGNSVILSKFNGRKCNICEGSLKLWQDCLEQRNCSHSSLAFKKYYTYIERSNIKLVVCRPLSYQSTTLDMNFTKRFPYDSGSTQLISSVEFPAACLMTVSPIFLAL